MLTPVTITIEKNTLGWEIDGGDRALVDQLYNRDAMLLNREVDYKQRRWGWLSCYLKLSLCRSLEEDQRC